MQKNGTVLDYDCIAMACQGGGSLGAYHIGSLQAMHEAGYDPTVVAGISIGAFTAAIIAGNEPEDRVAKLEEFWNTISWPDVPPLADDLGLFKKWHNMASSYLGFTFGQPGFFNPWFPPPTFQVAGTPAATSYYDTRRLYSTLPKVVNFKKINQSRKTRLILGATRVRDGSPRWFDSHVEEISPDHVMASGAMPPGFPGVRIGGELFWDGGCYSNTPLAGLYERVRECDTLCFVIDLFGPNGREPESMAEVNLTMKEIQFSNRLTHQIERVQQEHNFAHLLRHILDQHPDALDNHPHAAELKKLITDKRFDFMHILYQKPSYEVVSCDCEFSKSSILDRRQQGYRDMKKVLEQQPRLEKDQATAREYATQGSVINTFARGTLVNTSFHPAQTLSRLVPERGAMLFPRKPAKAKPSKTKQTPAKPPGMAAN